MVKLAVILYMMFAQIPQPLEAVEVQSLAEVSEPEPVFEIFEVTAYTAGIESTGKTPDHPEYGITASGAKVKANHTIACPKSMPFGTEIYIPHFDSVFTCEDRGSAITDGKLDVYMESVKDARKFGRRKLEVYIIKVWDSSN